MPKVGDTLGKERSSYVIDSRFRWVCPSCKAIHHYPAIRCQAPTCKFKGSLVKKVRSKT